MVWQRRLWNYWFSATRTLISGLGRTITCTLSLKLRKHTFRAAESLSHGWSVDVDLGQQINFTSQSGGLPPCQVVSERKSLILHGGNLSTQLARLCVKASPESAVEKQERNRKERRTFAKLMEATRQLMNQLPSVARQRFHFLQFSSSRWALRQPSSLQTRSSGMYYRQSARLQLHTGNVLLVTVTHAHRY